jgi:hypothetical protein
MTAITGAALIAEVESLAKQAGDKYFYGGDTPATGFDCSGLIYDALLSLGVSNPPRTSEAQYAASTKISASQLAPGDLVFAQFPGDNASPGHVGIYIGGGQIFSAQDPQLGIGISTLASWGSNIVGYGNIDNIKTTAGAGTTDTSLLGGIISWPSEITGFFSDADSFVTKLAWLVKPGNWLRIGAFGVAVVLIIIALYAFVRVGSDQPIIPKIQPIPVPV